MRFSVLEVFLLVGIGQYVHADDGGVACGIVDQLTCDDFEESRVCGSDGRDYFNDCDFAKAHCHDTTLHVGNVGACPAATTTPPPSTQPTSANPLCKVLLGAQCDSDARELCGTDGKTYFNLCKFEQAKCSSPGLAVDHVGACVTPSPLCQAFAIVQCETARTELCASDNITYPNLCYFQKAQCLDSSLSVIHEGPCGSSHAPGTTTPTPSTTPTSPDTSLDPHRQTLSPTCQALVIALCGSDVDARCGSDGITYANPCQLKKAGCLDPSITFVSVGHCGSPTMIVKHSTASKPMTSQETASLSTSQRSTTPLPVTSQKTTRRSTTPLPVTSQKTTRGSTTHLPITSQKTTQTTRGSTTPLPTSRRTTSRITVPVMTLSPLDIICRAIMHFNCPGTPEPVCGSDGKTYPNECEFEKQKCTHRHLHLASFGSCNK